MSKKRLLFTGLLGLGIALFIVSCNNENEAEKTEEMKDSITVADTGKKAIAEDDISYTLPSPAQIANMFKKSGLKFYNGITNPVDNASKYTADSKGIKAINLGIYSADLAYCLLNKQNQDTKNYFKTCKQLGSDLGLSKAFESNNIVQRIEKNMGNEDSLTRILAEIQRQTDDLLEESNQSHISVVSFAGAWVESMYIGMQVQIKEKNTNIAAKLVEQMAISENIVKALKANVGKEPEINMLITEIGSLNEIYNNFKSIKEIKATDPDFIDPAKVSIGITELYSFSKKVDEIRSRFIKG